MLQLSQQLSQLTAAHINKIQLELSIGMLDINIIECFFSRFVESIVRHCLFKTTSIFQIEVILGLFLAQIYHLQPFQGFKSNTFY